MNSRIGGTRSQPRVAIVGNFASAVLEQYDQLFPTTWHAEDFDELKHQVDYREIDLLILGQDVVGLINRSTKKQFVENAHIISFSSDIELPGPHEGTFIDNSSEATTEEYELPPLSLPFDHRRKLELRSIDNIRGWNQYRLIPNKVVRNQITSHSILSGEQLEKSQEVLKGKAIILGSGDQLPVALMYWREYSNLAVACLPHTFNQFEWVELIVTDWANVDRERFPHFGDWRKFPEWMIPEEDAITDRISDLEKEKSNIIQQMDQEIDRLLQKLARTTRLANHGRRRLLTAQGDELIEAVEIVFVDIGFQVENIDKILPEGVPKREDLRLRMPNGEDEDWEAIVEIRGYSRSAGKTSDLQRLSGRFTNFYQQEKGRLPSKKIYVVNGQLDIQNPSQRQEPLVTATEDVEEFAENDGLVISTLDLFRLAKIIDRYDLEVIRSSIKETTKRWKPSLLSQPSED